MFLLDDLLLLPARGIMAIFREVQKAAEQEMETGADTVRAQLCDLYLLLETKQISEAEFDDREHQLLDRLDAIEARHAATEEEVDEKEHDDDDMEDAEVVETETEDVAVSNAGK